MELSKYHVCACMLSHQVVSDSATPWTVAHQAPMSMEFSRQKYWSEFQFPTPGDYPDTGILLTSPASPTLADSLPLHHHTIQQFHFWVFT